MKKTRNIINIDEKNVTVVEIVLSPARSRQLEYYRTPGWSKSKN